MADRIRDSVRRARVGALLRRYRCARQLTYRELGRLSGIPWGTITSLESGRCRMGVAQLAALTPVLGTEFSEEILRQPLPQTAVLSGRGSAPRSLCRSMPTMQLNQISVFDFTCTLADGTNFSFSIRAESRADACNKLHGHLVAIVKELEDALNQFKGKSAN